MSIKAKGYPAWYVNQPLVLSSYFQGIALATFGGSLYIPSLNPKYQTVFNYCTVHRIHYGFP